MNPKTPLLLAPLMLALAACATQQAAAPQPPNKHVPGSANYVMQPEPVYRAPAPAYPGGYSPYFVVPGSQPPPPQQVLAPARPEPARPEPAKAEPEKAPEKAPEEPAKAEARPVEKPPEEEKKEEKAAAPVPALPEKPAQVAASADEPPPPDSAPLPLVEKAPVGAICHDVPRATIEGKWVRKVCRGDDGKWAYVAD